jgi:hypothetical protein
LISADGAVLVLFQLTLQHFPPETKGGRKLLMTPHSKIRLMDVSKCLRDAVNAIVCCAGGDDSGK